MKKLFIIVLLFAFGVQAQTFKTKKGKVDDLFLFGTSAAYSTLGANGDGADTSSAVWVKGIEGALVLWMVGDTSDATYGASVAANNSDSCVTVLLQLKDPDLGWGGLYSESTSSYTKLDTVRRSLVNTAAVLYLPLAEETSWVPADSARFIFQCGVGDTLPFKAKIGEGGY